MENILIVDDNTENLYLLDLLLKGKGYDVRKAGNGYDALKSAHQQKPDLIISDILMPVMDGFSLCREIKSDAMLSDTPFIFYTATYTDEKDEAYAMSLGADGFIKKPMEPKLFLNQITQLVSQYEHSPRPARKPFIKDEEESYKLYSERLIQKLEKKMLDLEIEVTHRIRVEEKLRIAHNEWEETFQAIAGPALLLDTDYNVIHANRSATQALKQTEDELAGKKCHEIFHYIDQPQHNCPMARLIESGKPQSIEVEVEALGGIYLLNCAPLTNKDGTIEKIIHIAVDITDRKKAEDGLKESEDRFRQLVEHLNEIFWIRDVHSEAILYISPMFETVFGLSVEAMYEDPYAFLDAVVKEDVPIVKNSHYNQLRKGQPTNITYRILKGGRIRWIHSKTFPIFDKNGNNLRIAGIAEDITDAHKSEVERKRLEHQLIQSQKMEAIGTLAGGIAHDFNNILSSIIGFTELTLDDVPLASSAHENLQEVLSAGMRAKELVRQILTLARKSENIFKPIKVSMIAKEALKLVRSTISANIKIKEKIDCEAFVMASASQLHQVFMNLMTNAAQAMQLNGGVMEVCLSDEFLESNPDSHSTNFIPGRYIKATVSDTGQGIPRKHFDDIFNPYFTTKDVGEGTGLGLSISHSIIKDCGGMVLLSSEVGKGTTLTVFLPVTASGAEPLPTRVESLPTGTERILIVDDEPAITRFIIQQLERLGYVVASRTSSVDALAVFKAAPDDFDLVITDMAMPNMTGDILSKQLLQIKPTLPIILCTGYSQQMTDARARQMGIKAFVMKPLLMEELALKIRKALDAE